MKKRRKRSRTKPAGAPKWMVTFSDLVTLILVFFILLFSVSQIDYTKFQSMADSFRDAGELENEPSIVPGSYPSDQLLDEVYRKVQSFLRENQLEEQAEVTRSERGVVLVLNEQFLFGSGQAELQPSALFFLQELGGFLAEIPNMLQVEGHTDNVPIQQERYPSNWELSAARASSVIRYFTSEHSLAPARFSAVGFADTRPIAPNDTEENRQKNRRVEIIILEPDLHETAGPAQLAS